MCRRYRMRTKFRFEEAHVDIAEQDRQLARRVQMVLLTVMELPADRLEKLVQLAHESGARQKEDPPEVFGEQGPTRQCLRMLWHFRCNLDAVMPREDRR